ncbi:MAG: hypothetical protein QOI12_4956 [Alphaproteobacteria bacterium]|jgi:hypothetical protein|nr:hypothetical protein [Alphaproteobacteria bacterium]
MNKAMQPRLIIRRGIRRGRFSRAAMARATAFPPPLRGRDRERGVTSEIESGTTSLRNPPPQGGREQTAFAAPLVAYREMRA